MYKTQFNKRNFNKKGNKLIIQYCFTFNVQLNNVVTMIIFVSHTKIRNKIIIAVVNVKLVYKG